MTWDRVQGRGPGGPGVSYSRGEALASYSHLSCPGLAVASSVLRRGACLVRFNGLLKLASQAGAPRLEQGCLCALPLAEREKKAGHEAPVSLGDGTYLWGSALPLIGCGCEEAPRGPGPAGDGN